MWSTQDHVKSIINKTILLLLLLFKGSINTTLSFQNSVLWKEGGGDRWGEGGKRVSQLIILKLSY